MNISRCQFPARVVVREQSFLRANSTLSAHALPISILITKLVQSCLSLICANRACDFRAWAHNFAVHSTRNAVMQLDVELGQLVARYYTRVREISQRRLVHNVAHSKPLDRFIFRGFATTAVAKN